jgi:hypothetical protein
LRKRSAYPTNAFVQLCSCCGRDSSGSGREDARSGDRHSPTPATADLDYRSLYRGGVGRDRGVGRGRGVALGVALGVGVGIGVAVAFGVGVGVGVGVAVAVGEGV